MSTDGKLFMIMLLTVTFLFVASSTYAVVVDFHGKGMIGLLGASNSYLLGGADDDSTTYGTGKFRFRAEVGTDDGRAKMVYGFETGSNRFGGEEWGYSGDSKDFENRFGYVQLSLPGLNDQVLGRGGLQKTGVNQWLWTETAAGITLHGKGMVQWSAGWFRGLEENWGEGNDINNNTDLYTITGNFKPQENLSVGGFGVYASDFGAKSDEPGFWNAYESGADSYWVGLTGKLDGHMFANTDLIYQGGDGGPNGELDISAFLTNLNVGMHVTERFKASVKGLYVSGDDDPDDGDLNAFQSIDADVDVGQIFYKDGLAGGLDQFVDDMFGVTSPDGLKNNGLATAALEGEFQLDPQNSLRGAVRYLQTAEEDEQISSGEDKLGTEVDLWYAYKYNKNLTLKLEGACLFPGDLAEKIFEDDDTVYQMVAGMVFAF
jgi:hypothetical protein